MALNIKDRRTDELARRIAELSETSITEAVRDTFELRVVELEKEREARYEAFMATVREIQARVAAAPVLDPRSVAEITDELDEDIFASH